MIRALLLAPIVVLILLAGIYLLTPQVDLALPAPHDAFVDAHIHFVGIGSHGSGCFVQRRLLHSYKFRLYLRAFGVTIQSLENNGDELIAERLDAAIARSRYVHAAVVPARDGIVRDGRMDRAATRIYVPGDFVARMAKKYPHLEYGASVNPDRPDWKKRLLEARRDGAVLVEWLPADMDIDPSNLDYVPYYHTLVALGLPLLVRIGGAGSFGRGNDADGDPRKLALPLREGVTVIATHLASTTQYDGETAYKRLLEMLPGHDKLYVDISGLTQINNVGYLVNALKTKGVSERMLYGSDWPLQSFPLVSPFYQWPDIDLAHAKTIENISNDWDRDVTLKMTLGVPSEVFQRSARLLAPGKSTPTPNSY